MAGLVQNIHSFSCCAYVAQRCGRLHLRPSDVRDGCAPCQGGALQWVQIPTGKRSSRKPRAFAVLRLTENMSRDAPAPRERAAQEVKPFEETMSILSVP